MQVDGEMVRLPGARGNNLQREKSPYLSSLTRKERAEIKCSDQCLDARICDELTVIPTKASSPRNPKILNQFPYPPFFAPARCLRNRCSGRWTTIRPRCCSPAAAWQLSACRTSSWT